MFQIYLFYTLTLLIGSWREQELCCFDKPTHQWTSWKILGNGVGREINSHCDALQMCGKWKGGIIILIVPFLDRTFLPVFGPYLFTGSFAAFTWNCFQHQEQFPLFVFSFLRITRTRPWNVLCIAGFRQGWREGGQKTRARSQERGPALTNEGPSPYNMQVLKKYQIKCEKKL